MRLTLRDIVQLQHAQHSLDQQRERPEGRPLLLAAHKPPGGPDAPVIVDAHVHIHSPGSRALQRMSQSGQRARSAQRPHERPDPPGVTDTHTEILVPQSHAL